MLNMKNVQTHAAVIGPIKRVKLFKSSGDNDELLIPVSSIHVCLAIRTAFQLQRIVLKILMTQTVKLLDDSLGPSNVLPFQ